MSIWAHITGTISLEYALCMFDSSSENKLKQQIDHIKKRVKEIIGQEVHYEDLLYDMYDPDKPMALMGSEGSISYNVDNLDRYIQVTIAGNLRDFNDINEIEKWYRDIIDKMDNEISGCYIREHILTGRIEFGETIILMGYTNSDGDTELIHKIVL